MIRMEKKNTHYLWGAVAAVLAFGVGFIHHRWFYPLVFHGDAAAMQILAKAILDQGSLLPSDFNYGNQIVFLRSSPFIALASVFGLAGVKAFEVGSSLSIAFWGVVLYVILANLFDSRRRAVFFSVLLLLPFGWFESDYILGQQSHLSNVVLSLGLAVFVSLFIEKKKKRLLLAASVFLFIMSLEAPIRGLLVLGPLLIAVLFVFGLNKAASIAVPMGISFVLAYISNKVLVRIRPISLDYMQLLSFKSSNEIVDNLARGGKETLEGIASVNLLAQGKISLAGLIILGAGLLLIALYLGFIFSGVAGIAKTVSSQVGARPLLIEGAVKANDRERLLASTAIFGLILGALAFAALNPDSPRHYLWSIFLIKLFILKGIFDLLSKYWKRTKSAVALVVLALCMSFWFASLTKSHWHPTRQIKERNFTEAVAAIEEVSKKTGIKDIFGEDFWRMMPLNTFIADINAQSLLLENGEIRPYFWLVMPSRFCAKGKVLYYLRDGSIDEKIRAKLITAGGELLKSGAGYTVWKGPRVWKMPASASNCYDASIDSSIDYRDTLLSVLPSNTGIREGSIRKTNGVAGFLTFGPYSPMQAGAYELNVYGSSADVDSAYVDVVSNGGNTVHGHFKLEKSVKGPLLFKSTVDLPTNVKDLEVRLWVDKDDSVELTGYSLKPASQPR